MQEKQKVIKEKYERVIFIENLNVDCKRALIVKWFLL